MSPLPYPYRLRPLAHTDLESHVDYLADQSLELAERFIESVYAAFETLTENPAIGAPRAAGSPRLAGLRLWPVPGFERWLIFYIPADTAVQIVRVLHGARDLPTLLER